MDTQNGISKVVPIWLLAAFIVVSLIGFSDAVYLTIKHYRNLSLSCGILEGKCDTVTNSQYASVGDVPIALIGAFYYLGIFVLVIIYLKSFREEFIGWAARLTVVGFLVSLWLVYLQLFVIKAICAYCLLSALAATALFILGLLYINLKGRQLTLSKND